MPRTVARIVYNRFPAIAAAIQPAVRAIVLEAAHEVELDIKAAMAQSKSGQVYGSHVASAPGEAPAMDTGALANSVQVESTGPTSAAVSSNQDYAAHLEYGTRRMAARPAWIPAAERVRPRFIQAMQGLERRLR